jgi:hypothetical protein
MEIAIRTNTKDVIDRIRFDEPAAQEDGLFADTLCFYSGDCNVWLSKSTEPDACLGIRNIRQAENLIKSIQKAIDLGWFE